MVIAGNIFYQFLGIGTDLVVVVGTIVLIGFYVIAAISGWEFASTKMAIERHERYGITTSENNEVTEYERILDTFQIKSDRNAFLLAFFTISVSIALWYMFDFQTGLTAFVAIPGFIRTVLFFRPKRGNQP